MQLFLHLNRRDCQCLSDFGNVILITFCKNEKDVKNVKGNLMCFSVQICYAGLHCNESLKGKQLDVTPGASNDKQIFTPMFNKSSV